MFSQCPKCESAFRITPEQLQQANGKVRCGKCQHVYNALSPAGLTPDEQAAEARPDRLNDPEEQRALEIEAQLDEIERTGQQPILRLETAAEEQPTNGTDLPEDAPDNAEIVEVDAATKANLPEEQLSRDAGETDNDAVQRPQDYVGSRTLTGDDIAEILTDNDEDLLADGLINDDYLDADDDDIDSGTIVMIDDDESGEVEPEDIDHSAERLTANSLDEDAGIVITADDDTLVPDEPLAKNGDDFEFDVPKQQWGQFFAGRYEGPIIDSVGPLDEGMIEPEFINYDIDQGDDTIEYDAGIDLTQSIAPEMLGFDVDDMLDTAAVNHDDDDEVLDDLEDLLEEESEALQTYSDLNEAFANDDIDTANDEQPADAGDDVALVVDEADTITAESDTDSETSEEENTSASALRFAVDTLSMEKADWQRLLEAADNESETLFAVEDDEPIAAAANADDAEALSDDDTNSDLDEWDDEFDALDDDDIAAIETNPDEYENIVLGSDDDEHDGYPRAGPLNKPTVADLGAPPLWQKVEPTAPKPSGKRRWLAAGGLLIAILLLASQLLHHNREALAADPDYGETVRKVYEFLDRPLYPAWELSAYKIRSSKAIYGESTQDLLDIRAQLAVTGDRPMGEPEIKVILKDRWGNPVKSWLFTPDQYMQGMRPPNGLIQPGTLIPITLSVMDPGSAAQGFQLAVCLRREGGVLQCDGQL